MELHFKPNSGGSKDKDITRFNAYFIDLDCEKDEKGNCLDLDTITAYKKKMMKKLSSFTPSCSAIVETYTPILPYSAFTRACNRLINQAALRQSPPGTGREVNSARRLVAQYALLRTVVLSSWSLACKNPREVIFAISYERYPAA